MPYEKKFGARQSKLRVGRKNSFGLNGGVTTDGSGVSLIKAYQVSVNPANLLANTGAETLVTVTGVTTDDFILCCMPAATLNPGISYSARVSAANTVAIHVVNATIGAIDVAATTFTIICARIDVLLDL